jgi:ribosomal protein L37AE/L43A
MKMEKFIDKIVYPIIAIVSANLILLFSGKLINDNWKSLYKSIPIWVLWAIFGMLFTWLIIVFIRNRMRKLKDDGGLPFFVVNMPVYGYIVIGILNYKSVKWRVLYPNDPSWDLNPSPINPDSIEIKSTPYCPNCENMELNEHRNLWGQYVWKCIRCGFKKKNGKSSLEESENSVIKLAKNEVAGQNHNN